MLAGETIICFAPDPWKGLWRNRHQIMTRLARRNTVLYVEPRLYFPETWRRFRDGRLRVPHLWAPLGILAGDEAANDVRQGGLWLYHDPYYAPFAGRLSGGPLTAALRRRALLRTVRAIHDRQGAGQPRGRATARRQPRPILWLLRPYQADQIGQYNEKLVVYHVTDEYSAYPMVTDKAAFLAEEETLLRRADIVIVTSPALLARKGQFNPHTYLVPNAVDYAGFRKALAQSSRSDIRGRLLGEATSSPDRNRQPIAGRAGAPPGADLHLIGYAGALNEKLDFRLLAEVARARLDWRVILIGTLDLYTQKDKAAPLAGLPNVHWVGPVPVGELPRAIAAFDVCLLPYEINAWTANIDSLKLYEYLACGRPVVSTPIPVAISLRESTIAGGSGLVRIADDAAGFVAEISAALAEDDPVLVERREAFAAANTWEHRVAAIEELLQQTLERTGR